MGEKLTVDSCSSRNSSSSSRIGALLSSAGLDGMHSSMQSIFFFDSRDVTTPGELRRAQRKTVRDAKRFFLHQQRQRGTTGTASAQSISERLYYGCCCHVARHDVHLPFLFSRQCRSLVQLLTGLRQWIVCGLVRMVFLFRHNMFVYWLSCASVSLFLDLHTFALHCSPWGPGVSLELPKNRSCHTHEVVV